MATDGASEPAKILLPFLQRADELQKHDPLVAYYCRLYAMERGMRIPSKERSKTMNAILVSVMNQLEKDKKSLKFSADDNLHVEGFALNVFTKADKQDRSGRADLNTAKTFYAASIFFEVLNQFGELQPEIEQKQKYAVWKAADIRKAISEGRKPQPGPPGGDEGFSLDEADSNTKPVDDSYSNQADADAAAAAAYSKSSFEQQPGSVEQRSSKFSSDQQPGFEQHPSSKSSFEDPSSKATFDQHQGWKSPFDQQGSAGYGAGASYYPSSPPGDHLPASQPDPLQHEGSYPSGTYFPSGSSDKMGGESGFSTTASYASAYYPTSSFDYQAPSSYPSTYSTAPAPGYAASAPPPSAYENPMHRTSSAPPPLAAASEYKPTPDKVTESHKAARFAVSALAFDDVPTAVSYLRRSLELLTSPSSTL